VTSLALPAATAGSQPRNAGQYSPIDDYAIIGDSRSAGLISRDGSLDWLCLPRFDSPSIFAALLDAEHGGRFRVRPTGAFTATRRYIPETNVLETTFVGGDGSFVLRDLMPVAAEEDKRAALLPEHEVLRELEGLSGEIEVEVCYAPRPDYGRQIPALEQHGSLGIWCDTGESVLILGGDLRLDISPDRQSASGVIRLVAGERRYLSFTCSTEAPAVIPLLGAAARARIERSIRWWRDWAGRCTYDGPYRDAVVRSALTLKLLTYAPSGAIIAAPTTSLPERVGGERNWDYRYCWLRDASFTLRALYDLGYDAEAGAFLGWMLHATRLTWPELQVLYDVFGEAKLPETEFAHLDGYEGSRPVRIGNDAFGQLQLDVYGEVIDAGARFAGRGGRFDRDTTRMLNGLGQTVCTRWMEPDEGIWEGRSGRFHHTHSKVLCWVALDRLIAMHEDHGLAIDTDRFRTTRDAIRSVIEEHGYNERLGSYTRVFDGDELDASLLTLPLYGYIDGAHPRMRSTCTRIHERLAHGHLVYRYDPTTDDGLPSGEGAFGICSFWAVECQARGGDLRSATRAFEELLLHGNDLGLFAEEIDPDTGMALGNFPQAFTHIGLINAALTLAECADPLQTAIANP
jgi:GH15 family glucan-1,4-alpha-glucosidase